MLDKVIIIPWKDWSKRATTAVEPLVCEHSANNTEKVWIWNFPSVVKTVITGFDKRSIQLGRISPRTQSVSVKAIMAAVKRIRNTLICWMNYPFLHLSLPSIETRTRVQNVFANGLLTLLESMSKWHPRRRISTNGLATSIKRSCLDRTDYIQAKKGETTSFLALKWLKKTLKSPIVWELFPRARLIANMNIDFKNYL